MLSPKMTRRCTGATRASSTEKARAKVVANLARAKARAKEEKGSTANLPILLVLPSIKTILGGMTTLGMTTLGTLHLQ